MYAVSSDVCIGASTDDSSYASTASVSTPVCAHVGTHARIAASTDASSDVCIEASTDENPYASTAKRDASHLGRVHRQTHTRACAYAGTHTRAAASIDACAESCIDTHIHGCIDHHPRATPTHCRASGPRCGRTGFCWADPSYGPGHPTPSCSCPTRVPPQPHEDEEEEKEAPAGGYGRCRSRIAEALPQHGSWRHH